MAVEAFADPTQVVRENYLIGDEQRYGLIGLTQNLVLLLVVFVDRSRPDIEVIHIITARKATKYEQDAYADQFR